MSACTLVDSNLDWSDETHGAAVADLALLTRDVRRYRTYFPSVRLLAPQL